MGGAAAGGKSNGSPHLASLATMIKTSNTAGHDFNEFIEKIKAGTKHFGGEDELKKLTAADLLIKSEMMDEVANFLPSLDEESTQKNLPALKIWSQLALAKYKSKKVAEWLDKAWSINQTIVGLPDLSDADKDLALTNLIELSPQVDKDLGEAWLNASFTEEIERGMVILTNLGTKSAELAGQSSTIVESERLELLRLQNQAAEKLIKQSSDKAKEWNQALTLMIKNWLTEAETSLAHSKENSRQGNMNIDMYGNFYWGQQQRNMNPMGPKPIKIGDILEILPSENWQSLVDPSSVSYTHLTLPTIYSV